MVPAVIAAMTANPAAAAAFAAVDQVRIQYSTPDGENYLEHYFTPTGDLKIPVLTVHTTGDPETPFFHEALYGARVAAAGTSGMLLQRTIVRFGHCNITPAEHLAALGALEGWIATGIKPPF